MIINILGNGLMGKQISALMYLGGFEVHIWNHKEVVVKDVLRQVKLLKRSFNTGLEGKIIIHKDLNDMPDAVTIESVVEDLEVKREFYKKFESSGMPYFTNSSSFAPSEVGEKVNGFHFFNPISLKLLEMYLNSNLSIKSVKPIIDYLERLEFEVVSVNDNRGYIGNYVLFSEISSALKLIEKFDYGVNQINKVYSKLYEGRDIFSIIDLIGIDIVFKILTNLKEDDSTIYMPLSLKLALDKDILGRKNKTSIRQVLS